MMAQHDTGRIIEEFLGEHPRASEWRALRRSLEERLLGLRRQRRLEAEGEADAERVTALDAQIAAMDRQIAALETEEAVAQFVEDSLKFTLAQNGFDEEEGQED